MNKELKAVMSFLKSMSREGQGDCSFEIRYDNYVMFIELSDGQESYEEKVGTEPLSKQLTKCAKRMFKSWKSIDPGEDSDWKEGVKDGLKIINTLIKDLK